MLNDLLKQMIADSHRAVALRDYYLAGGEKP